MHIIVVILHVVMAVLLVTIVLLQKGKGASMGAVFGGSSSTIFGSSGPGTFLGKMTTWIALIFMITSL
ncbi:MAG: preprotein translocase subunit SecG, partial [Syntrophales bacterium]|nr:preprotein translocase subunit SecG [Syntrophales bacterium]